MSSTPIVPLSDNTPVTPPPAVQPSANQQQAQQDQTVNAAVPVTPEQPQAPTPPSIGDRSKHVLGDIFQTLAGGQKIVYQQTPNGPVKTYQDLKPGEMARGILAAAITGLAGGYDPANRGKGPAMSAAFSGGFKAEEKARQQQQEQQEQEAQQEFKNQGEADARKLAAHRDALAQQESIRQAQKWELDMRALNDQLARGERADAEHIEDREAKDWMTMQDLQNSGGKPILGPNGKPLTFNTPHEMSVFANASEANRKLLSGSDAYFNTQLVHDPTTKQWMVYTRPIDDHQARWMGVLLDKNHQPILKDGEMQIDPANPWYGPNGKPAVPVSKMTPAEFLADNRASRDIRSSALRDKLTSLEIAEKSEQYNQLVKQDHAYDTAQKHMDQAGDNLNAIDPKTQLPYVTADDRNYLQTTLSNQATNETVLGAKLGKEINDLVTAGAKDSDPELVQLRARQAASTARLEQMQNQQLVLKTSNTDAVVANLRKQYGDETGKVTGDNLAKAKTAINQLPEGMQKTVIENIGKASNPIDQAVDKLRGLPVDKVAEQLKMNNVNAATQAIIYQKLGLTPPGTPVKATPSARQPAGAAEIKAVVKDIGEAPTVNIPGQPPIPIAVPENQ